MHLLKQQMTTQSSTVYQTTSTSNQYQTQTTLSKNDAKLAAIANMDPAALSKKSKIVRKDTTYHPEISVHCKADPGMNLCLLGRIPELSMWDKDDPKCWMKKTAGDIWVMEKPVVTNQFFFTYKFALYDQNRQFV